MPKYRTCIATERIHKPVPAQGTMRMLDIHEETIDHAALFHAWSHIFSTYAPVTFGQFVNQASTPIGIVEYEDGTIHEHLPQEIQFTDGKAEKIFKNKKDEWNKLTDDTDSYPETYENVLFKTSDGRIYYGCCGTDLDWSIEIENGIVKIIKDVVEWRKIQS